MLQLYNSLTGIKEDFHPLNGSLVNIYVCGPTVYDHLHIGNIRSLIFFNLLKKYLMFIGFKVFWVVNITDLDDKIIKVAIKNKSTERQIANYYKEHFFNLLDKLDIHGIDKFPLVTDYINQMIIYISLLLKKKYAYLGDKGIYFCTNSIIDYGRLSSQNINKLYKNVHRKNVFLKQNSEDFVLWKKTDIGISYSSPWFLGRPGWHTECVVMIREIFRNTIDIHGGGHDLKFPHHENEQAQFIASDGKPLARYFMHVGHVNYHNHKMSKSLNNVILVKDLLVDIKEPNVIKFLFCHFHYLKPINYTKALIYDIKFKYFKIVKILNKINFILVINNFYNYEINKNYLQKFHKFMQNDIDTPNVVTLIEQLLKNISKNINNLLVLSELYYTLIYILNNLDISVTLNNVTEQMIEYYYLWQQAKNIKDFNQADFFRNILLQKNFI
ncbi:MAG: cysteine--tRNA ligase [Candidatus Phytoplasma australasiaticum]|nr:cysteine--tRNA ligase [Candidatus Phytoplasma australasiaticum]MDV3153553.1 cysteine--tRNA ligase [Candidatus Phytoplasma australasiaticum]MDV3167392.1 cysteine--tRNA ligase [Candidatus Phytoplasma australasiaticum]MDV3180764.1 cysteine--tRNA ligase [Candidatus Phytoplasma australasiaticum]MDV3182948.1 cysteine--tRNA ligase [Candidatus Phytoplasma australasiaticum]